MVIKAEKVRFVCFCSLFDFDLAQNTIVVYFRLRKKPIETFGCVIHASCMSAKKELCTVVDLPT